MNLTLTLSHNLFLTRDQCYELNEKGNIEVVGVNIPVWIKKGKISEPTVEVFSKYKITTGDELSIKERHKVYELCLPKVSRNKHSEQDACEHTSILSKNLLDIKDGGCEWLAFRQNQSIKRSNKMINLIHFIEIKRMDDLLETLS